MASVRFKGKHWFARFRDGRGRRVERRTPYGKQQKRLADGYALKLETQAQHVRDGLEKATERMTLGELWRRLGPIMKQKRSWASIEGRWRNHILPTLGEKLIHAIDPADIESLMAAKREEGLGKQTVDHLRVHLSAAFSFAIKKLRVLKGENPAAIAERLRIPPPRPVFLDAESHDRLLEKVQPQWAGIFAVAAYTGLRKGEVLGLQLNDVDLGRHLLWVCRSYDNETTKGGKGRVVAFPPELTHHLAKAMGRAAALESVWLFPRFEDASRAPNGGKKAKAGDPMGPDTKLGTPLRKALKAAGIKAPPRFSFKSLRSTYATHLAEVTGDLRVVQRQLGHSSPVITERAYAFARDRHLAEQVGRLPFGKVPHRLPTDAAELNVTERNDR